MKKKQILWLSSILLLSAILISSALILAAHSNNSRYDLGKINEGGAWKEVSDGIFIITGDYPGTAKVNMVLVVDGEEATLIDAGNGHEEGVLVTDYLAAHKLTLKNFIITHRHNDHIQNIDRLTQGQEVNVYDFDNAENNQLIQMGQRKFKILVTPGHCDDRHISVELVDERILAAGDVVVTCYPPLLLYGGDSRTLEETLKMLRKNNYELIIPGHGDIINAKKAIDVQLDYLQKTRKKVAESLQAGVRMQDLQKSIKAEECFQNIAGLTPVSINSIHTGNLQIIYLELKKEQKTP